MSKGKHCFRSLLHRIIEFLLLPLCLSIGQSLLSQDQRIFQMVHTAWTAKDGAPQSINALAQTTDGTLWMGTRDGLYSFDGLKFSVSNLVPRKNIQFLFAAQGGDLWLAGQTVPLMRIHGGVAATFDRVENDRFRVINQVAQESDGSIWAILNFQKLVCLGNDGVWHIVAGPKPDGNRLGPIFIDSSDTQWIFVDNLLYRRPRGEAKFEPTDIRERGVLKISEGLDRSIWIAGNRDRGAAPSSGQPPDVGLKHIDRLGKRLSNPLTSGPLTHDDVSDVVAAADGSVWVSHTEGGIQRLRANEIEGMKPGPGPDFLDLYGVSDGLTTTGFRVLLRDRDGEVWVAGGRGLDKFQVATLVPVIPNAINGWWSFCAAPNGDILMAVLDGFRARVHGDRVIRLKDRGDIASMLCGDDGRVWLFTGDGIAEQRADHPRLLPVLPGTVQYWQDYRFSSIVPMPDGRLIASTRGGTENRLWFYQKGVWRLAPPFGEITGIDAMMMSSGRLYLGSSKGMIFCLNSQTLDKVFAFSSQIGAVKGFSDTRYGVIAFGENGVGLLESDRIQILTFANPDLATSVTGLAEDQQGDIWINGSRAIARVLSSEISKAIKQPTYRMEAREFREGEFRGSDIFNYSRNSAKVDKRGRVWLATANGIVYIDPQSLDRPSHLPTVSIRSIAAGGRPLGTKQTIAPGTETLNIQYFGLNLVNPESVVYRYRLQGYDPEWQNVGGRSEAIYTHLRPGKYTFQVIASSGNQIWTAPVSAPPITVLPGLYQTWWFEALCIVLAVALLWLGYTLRVRAVAAGIRSRAEERAEERIRIARELHDTLLQGVQGLQLSFHAAAAKIPDENESKRALEKALATADRMILEGRNRIHRLRSQHLTSDELEPAIAAAADELLASFAQGGFSLEKTGTPRALNPQVVDEIFFIAREALTNSFRHSHASSIAIALEYREDRFTLVCRDNGCGFDVNEFGEAAGHWGLRGMAERAERIGASFKYESAPGEGTLIRADLPAKRAYLERNGLKAVLRRYTT